VETLKTTPNIVDLQELQSILKEAGIESVISENSSPYIDASGNITTYSLLVGDDNLDKAIEIARKFNETAEQPTSCSWCPECGSEDITMTKVKLKRSSIAFPILGVLCIIIAFILPLGVVFSLALFVGGIFAVIQYFRGHTEERYVCNKCNHKFKRI
jgi:DNA-directed RNA polymerase subunit RPC12/RpoP